MLMYVGDREVVMDSSPGATESEELENDASELVGLEDAGGDGIAELL